MRAGVALCCVVALGCGKEYAPVPCTLAADGCGAGTRCEELSGACVPCDADHDGYLYDAPSCAITTDRPPDCDDADRSVHPGGVAICGNGRVDGCGSGTHVALSRLLPVAEASTFDVTLAEMRTATMETPRVAVGLTQGGASGSGVAHVAWSVRGTARHELRFASFPLDAADGDHVVLTGDDTLRGAFPFDARWVDLRWAGPGDPNAVGLASYGLPSDGVREHAGGYLRDLASGDVYADVLSDDTGYAVDMPTSSPIVMTGGGHGAHDTTVALRVTHERDWPGHGISLFSSMPTAELPDATSLVAFSDAFPPLDLRASDGRWALISSNGSGRLWTWNAAAESADMRLYEPRPLHPELTVSIAPFSTTPAFARLGDLERYVLAIVAHGTTYWGLVNLDDPDAPIDLVYPDTYYYDPYASSVLRLAADHVPDHELAVVARSHPYDASSRRDGLEAAFVSLLFVDGDGQTVLFADTDDTRGLANELHQSAAYGVTTADLHVAAMTGRDGVVTVVVTGVDMNPYEGTLAVWAAGVRLCPTL